MGTEHDRNASPEQPDAAERLAEERFIDDLIARGEAVPEGQDIPPGATHVVIRGKDGRRALRRVRFAGPSGPSG